MSGPGLGALDTLARRLEALGLRPHLGHPLAREGFWRIGGPADLFVDLQTPEQLALCLGSGLPLTVLGKGSNLLVADAGIRGLTVRLKGRFRDLSMDPDTGLVEAGGGVLNAVLLKRLDEAGLAGLGCLAGVPGTVGGAIRMNAGTSLGWIDARTREVELVLPGGEVQRLGPEALDMGYRRAVLPEGAVVSRVWLQATATDLEAHRAEVAHHLSRRKATQPLSQPSCGSVFENPPGDHAGRLVEAVGLKGHQHGGAAISEVHANFIVNLGDATAWDVHHLVTLARQAVHARFGVVLQPEVHAVGDWPAGTWPLPPLS